MLAEAPDGMMQSAVGRAGPELFSSLSRGSFQVTQERPGMKQTISLRKPKHHSEVSPLPKGEISTSGRPQSHMAPAER